MKQKALTSRIWDQLVNTCISTDIYKEMLDMISTVQQFAAGVKIIVWDLGLKNTEYVQKVSVL